MAAEMFPPAYKYTTSGIQIKPEPTNGITEQTQVIKPQSIGSLIPKIEQQWKSLVDVAGVNRCIIGVNVNGIKVSTADVAADNGVVHVIGRVLMPPAGNIVETAVASGLDSLVKAVLRATNGPGGDPTLANTLSTARLTVFAPTNAAFTQLLGALSLTDINQIAMPTLLAVLRYHEVG